jgi:alpha-1,2-mannosyltransferase
MAAGTIILAHNSGGPKEDIVVKYNSKDTGFLAQTVDEYAEQLVNIYNLSTHERNLIRQTAREHVSKFGQAEFNQNFMNSFNKNCFSLLKS